MRPETAKYRVQLLTGENVFKISNTQLKLKPNCVAMIASGDGLAVLGSA